MKRERLDPAEYKKMEDFEDEHPHYNARFLEILREFGKKRTELSYNQLFLNIEELKIMLTHIESLDSAGRIDVGFHNPWRNVANAIIEAYTSAEMFVCIKAIQDLKQDSNNNEARLALKKLLRESREYMVIHSAYKLYRGLGLKL